MNTSEDSVKSHSKSNSIVPLSELPPPKKHNRSPMDCRSRVQSFYGKNKDQTSNNGEELKLEDFDQPKKKTRLIFTSQSKNALKASSSFNMKNTPTKQKKSIQY